MPVKVTSSAQAPGDDVDRTSEVFFSCANSRSIGMATSFSTLSAGIPGEAMVTCMVRLAGLVAAKRSGSTAIVAKMILRTSRVVLMTMLRDTNGVELVRPNVRAKRTVEADAGWPRKDDFYHGLERPDGGRRSGSALERGVRPRPSWWVWPPSWR